MLTLADLRALLEAKPSACVGRPFGPGVLVYKIGGKVFAILGESGEPRLTLKCDPVLSEIMRAAHAAIQPGYHTDKRHWITIRQGEALPDAEVARLADHAYDLVRSKLTRAAKAALAAAEGPVSRPLLRLLDEDRAEDRSVLAGAPEYVGLRRRDAARRAQVEAVLREQPALTVDQLFAAAWILNHGDTAGEARRAHELAKRAAEQGFGPAKWLAATALDRTLMYSGRPQRYGTNIVPDGVGYRLWDVEPETTDVERAEWDVPPLTEMRRRAAEMSSRTPQPPLDEAPEWLLEAIKRWKMTS